MAIVFPANLMVSVSGFRGIVGDPLTPELLGGLAAAFGAFLKEEGSGTTVYVARDSRTSGPMLARAAIAGLQSVGCDVVDVGVVPTPTLMLAVEDADEAAGGIGITASHNPAEWNAMKFASAEGMFLDGERMARFQSFVRERTPVRAAWDALGTVERDATAVSRHLARILELELIDVPALRQRSFRVALDCVNGAGGAMMMELLGELGCRVQAIGLEPTGHFHRDPEPTPGNLHALGDLVREIGADIGLAVDPDVDRLSLVDETGTPMGEDLTLALASDVVLRRNPGTVVTNLSTSQVLEDVARAHGSAVVRSPVGEINVARRMQEVDAVIGGEGNGGVILPSVHYTRDAPMGAALIMQHLLDEGRTTSEAVGRWPSYSIVKEKIDFPRSKLDQGYAALTDRYREADRSSDDGLRFSWEDRRAWLHVRPSGTEPVVRLIAEASDESQAREMVDESRRTLEGVV